MSAPASGRSTDPSTNGGLPPHTSLVLFRRWPVTVRLLAGSIVALTAIAAVGLVSVVVITRQRTALDNLAMLSRTQRILQDADMEHAAILADVLAIDNSWAQRPHDELQHQLEHDISAYRKFLITAESMPLPDELRQAIADVEPDLDAYVNRAVEIAERSPSDRKALVDKGAIQQSFDRLTDTNKRLTDLFAARVASADLTADEAAKSAVKVIAIACLGAVVIVALAGRVVTRSVSKALGRVRFAAEAISDGELSVRSEVYVQDDIGAVASAVNRMADTLQNIIGRLQAEQEQDAFSRQLSEVLDMADTEADTHRVIARGMLAVTKDMPMELLVADSSRAHLERAAVHPAGGSPGCTVESPYGCMAVRRGNPIVFDNSEALNACTYLRDRSCGPTSAVCVPLSFMGRALGVLHATSPVDRPPVPRVVSQLTTLGILASGRIGTVRAFQRTQVQASTDGLTGLPNRRSLESKVRAMGAGASYAFVLVDLDHFKQLNDKHGHEAGDQALRIFADVLRQSLRDEDHPARWGGEEFAILLEGRHAPAALELVDRIRARMVIAMQGAPAVTASFGIADTTMAGTFEQLLRIADDALYQSKEGGRDRGTIGDNKRVAHTVPRRQVEHLASVNVNALVATADD